MKSEWSRDVCVAQKYESGADRNTYKLISRSISGMFQFSIGKYKLAPECSTVSGRGSAYTRRQKYDSSLCTSNANQELESQRWGKTGERGIILCRVSTVSYGTMYQPCSICWASILDRLKLRCNKKVRTFPSVESIHSRNKLFELYTTYINRSLVPHVSKEGATQSVQMVRTSDAIRWGCHFKHTTPGSLASGQGTRYVRSLWIALCSLLTSKHIDEF